jgi:RNA polymerase sigma-70 factor (ECF subfamily)
VSDDYAAARAAWPGVELTRAAFDAAIAERGEGTLHATDVYLALGCAAGDPAALAAFEVQCGDTIRRATTASGATPAESDDLAQVVRQRLLVAPASGGPAKIVSYSGRGSLQAWVKVVATREAARMLPIARREPALADDDLARLVAPDDDPEIGYLKRLYRAEFKQAFQLAVAALPARDRLVLRQSVLDGLGIDALAAQHGVHRATCARWLEAARQQILAATQAELVQRLSLSRAELQSVIKLIASSLEVSLARVL